MSSRSNFLDADNSIMERNLRFVKVRYNGNFVFVQCLILVLCFRMIWKKILINILVVPLDVVIVPLMLQFHHAIIKLYNQNPVSGIEVY